MGTQREVEKEDLKALDKLCPALAERQCGKIKKEWSRDKQFVYLLGLFGKV